MEIVKARKAWSCAWGEPYQIALSDCSRTDGKSSPGRDSATWQGGEMIEKELNDAYALPSSLVEKSKAAMDLP